MPGDDVERAVVEPGRPQPAEIFLDELDLALGIGGLPRGRVIEIFGPESSGKSTLAMHVVAEAQRNGGICAYVDAEHAMDPTYAARIGVDVVREVMPRSQLVPKLLRDGAAGTLPDLVLSDNPDLPKLASTGALLPLDDEVDTEGFYDSVLDTGRYDGELYGVAPGVNGLALFYDR